MITIQVMRIIKNVNTNATAATSTASTTVHVIPELAALRSFNRVRVPFIVS